MANKKTGTATSWLTVVKRVFRSPTKDDNGKKSCRRRDENHEIEEEEKKRDKRRWLFRRPAPHVDEPPKSTKNLNPVMVAAEQSHVMAMAAATAAAAEAVAATAQAAVEIVRLTRHSTSINGHYYAAVVIQTAFRGYLARRALRALKGLVKLQALVRGQNVRKQAKLTLKYMQALVRVQDHVRHQRARLSLEGSSSSRRKSLFDEINGSLWDSSYLQDVRNRVSLSRETTSGADYDWDYCPQTNEDIEAKLQSRKEASLKREKALAYAFSHKIWRSGRNPSAGNEEEMEERSKWLDRWMATKQWENTSEQRRDTHIIRTVEVDTSATSGSLSSCSVPNFRKQHLHHQQQPHKAQQPGPHVGPNNTLSSPIHKAQYTVPFGQYSSTPVTPSPSKPKPLKLKLRSASPRCSKEEKCYSAAHTPNFGSGATCRFGSVPNYMAATESAKARARPLSAPRQRPSTPERDQRGGGGGSIGGGGAGCGSAKKRLYYPVLELQNDAVGNGGCGSFCSTTTSQQLRSPGFKSLQNGFYGMENLSSCYTESLIGRDVSPCSTTDLRRLK